MSSIHYFQRFSQPENVTTNNTLLLFSRLNSYNQRYFEIFINDLLGIDLSIGINIEQQKSIAKGTVPDGFIQQSSFKIVLETKRHADFDISQLERHLANFKEEERKILMLLGTETPGEEAKLQIRIACRQRIENLTVSFVSFSDIIEKFKSILHESRDFEMMEMIEEYEAYCNETGLVPTWKYNLRVRTAPYSFDYNLKHRLYYDSINRGFTQHGYFGLYRWKSVRAIGKVVNIVRANLVNGQLEDVHSDFNLQVTDEQKQRIIEAIFDAPKTTGDNIHTGTRFFMVDEFFITDFKKDTPYPIQKSKNMNLLWELNMSQGQFPDSAEEIARMLNGKSWKS